MHAQPLSSPVRRLLTAVVAALVCYTGLPHSVSGAQSSEAATACDLEQRFSPGRPGCGGPVFVSPERTHGYLPPTRAVELLPLTLTGYGRSAYPMERDNGLAWAGKGVSARLEGGVRGHLGPLHFAVAPVVAASTNDPFSLADTVAPGRAPEAYPWERSTIDWPQRPGREPLRRWSPGESFVEIRGPLGSVVGAGTERFWWGPSRRYPMLVGSTARGFPHAYVRTPALPVGPVRLHASFFTGAVGESDYFDEDPANDERSVTALRVEWNADRWIGLTLAATALVRQERRGMTFSDLLRVVPLSSQQDPTDLAAVDGMGTLTARWSLADGSTRLFGTWGRGDYFLNLEDLITQPEHVQFWNVGVTHDYSLAGDPDGRWTFAFEHASTAGASTQFGGRSDFSEAVYRHSDGGHTHRGELLGASIGPGAVATYAAFSRLGEGRQIGLLVERVLWDVDAAARIVSPRNGGGIQDREWIVGASVGDEFVHLPRGRLRFDLLGGIAHRRDRQYVRYTGDNRGLPRDEVNLWVDVRLTWLPPGW